MSTSELNKLAGAALFAGLIAMVAFVISKEVFHEEHADAPVAYPVAGTEEEGELEAAVDEDVDAIDEAVEEAGDGDGGLSALLAAADAAKGSKIFKKCAACHTSDEGGKNKVGPNLWDIVDRPVGRVEGFKYSEAMAGHGGTWTFESLSDFLMNPKGAMPGTKMAFGGIKDDGQRADLLLFLRSLSRSPVDLPGG